VRRLGPAGSEPPPPHVGGYRERQFTNEPPIDFTISSEREKMAAAIRDQRQKLGRRFPLIINNKPVSTSEWLPSLNPANQEEVVGYAAQATVA